MALSLTLKTGVPRKSDLLVGFAIFEPVSDAKDEADGDSRVLGTVIPEGIRDVVASTHFRAKRNATLLIHGRSDEPAAHFLIVGLGLVGEIDAETMRRAGGAIAAAARKHSASSADIMWPSELDSAEVAADSALEALCEGLLLGAYHYTLKTGAKKKDESVKNAAIYLDKLGAPQRTALQRAEHVAAGVFVARDLINMPSNYCTPATLAEAAEKLAGGPGGGKKAAKKAGARPAAGDVHVTVFEKDEIKKMGMGGLIGVNQGSDLPPVFVCIEYKSGRKGAPTIAFVGKGITFDTGGYSLKINNGMVGMKHDMAGAGAVIGLMKAVAERKPSVNVVGIVPATENMISGKAYKVDDVLTMYNGKTVEVGNTDAEGRLIVADALAYASKQYKPEVLVDFATLTGACVIALGKECAAVLSNDDALAADIIDAGKATGERAWQLPLWHEYGKKMESKIADLKNVGGDREAGTITAGWFLSQFVDLEKIRWAHLDIAGVAWKNGDDLPYCPAGATAYGVRIGLALVEKFEAAHAPE